MWSCTCDRHEFFYVCTLAFRAFRIWIVGRQQQFFEADPGGLGFTLGKIQIAPAQNGRNVAGVEAQGVEAE